MMPRGFRYLLGFALIVLLYMPSTAQHRCSTDEYHQEMMDNDPKYAKRYKDLVAMVKSSTTNRSAVCDSIITIPVAIHFNDPIDCSNASCLLDIVEAQIDVMNEDFLALNVDYQFYEDLNAACPTAYPMSTAPTAGTGSCVQFCLARMNHPTASGLSDGDPAITVGLNDWPSASDWDGYLNIFVSNSQGGLGVSPLPGSADGDGFWVTTSAFGGPGISCSSGGSLNNNGTYNLGRTATHEAGHYLGLPHVFGGNCDQDPDSNPPGPEPINDTPSQDSPFFGTATVNNCSDVPEECTGDPSSLFSFMDYTDDEQMVIFTEDQSTVINWHANDINFNSNTTYCSGSYGEINCVEAPSCTDGLQNQDEQDVDCGGINCSDCASWCGKDFYDPGGPDSDYANLTFNTWTFCPDDGNQILSIDFNFWNVENNNSCSWDEMIIYDGNNDSAPMLGSWCTNSPGTVTASTPGGCLHVTFETDFAVVEEGWEATIACSIVLPVELTKFTGKADTRGNHLEWVTEIEIQNEGFYVERSLDGKTFNSIGFVEGLGDWDERAEYSFIDTRVDKSTNYYYRLKQVDFNGDLQYTEIIQIKSLAQLTFQVSVFPNPVILNILNIDLGYNDQKLNTTVQLFDMNGRLVFSQATSEDIMELSFSDVGKGVYLLRIEQNGAYIHNEKIVKLK